MQRSNAAIFTRVNSDDSDTAERLFKDPSGIFGLPKAAQLSTSNKVASVTRHEIPKADERFGSAFVSEGFNAFNRHKLTKEKEKLERELSLDESRGLPPQLLAQKRERIAEVQAKIEACDDPVCEYEEEEVIEMLPETGGMIWKRGGEQIEVALIWIQKDGTARKDPIDVSDQYRGHYRQESGSSSTQGVASGSPSSRGARAIRV